MPASPAVRSEARPLLSLCLATYNRAHYLERYLTHHLTAFEAAGIDYELVVSDNGSTDGTPKILADWAARHPRMRVMRQPRNLGAYPNILTTLREARGEFVVSIADDDLAVPHQLLAYVEAMAADPALCMVQAPWYLIDETQGDAITGKFYDFDGERRFGAGEYARCLAFLLE
ncbi:MAG: glycosyltransferase family 2 protein, partial [Phenylobacterium sp.]|nr:glycosyltransferase family 2 protein [Phenylobacterium sp.]